jgi:hypothetical protein
VIGQRLAAQAAAARRAAERRHAAVRGQSLPVPARRRTRLPETWAHSGRASS